MRELAKSTLRFSWAMSLLGMKGLFDIVSQRRSTPESGGIRSALDSGTSAAVNGLSETWKDAFNTGDQVQQGIVEATFRMAAIAGLGGCGCKGATGSSGSGSKATNGGWGPMPPNQG